ncbi:hypothetical protein [Sporolituus thermophilus]|uniref:Uncharacterized protein n=1 Tax=Sporolituus thermophilus DSM 23256 TaxID=1123285 RepID=A0A1G7LH14_9FIRM|nr:hypothetical protein [Sporolituus thermophilus]SDF48733.1 hypothetical protein SAMN05660235_01768 [Sporolituus thermophilus DSM 23256]
MEFSFTLYQPKKERAPKEMAAQIEIRPNGRIVFNKKAAELLADRHFCMLGYDREKNALGIMPVTEQQLNSFPIRYASKGAYIGAKKFFKHFNILPQKVIQNSPVHTGQFIGVKL